MRANTTQKYIEKRWRPLPRVMQCNVVFKQSNEDSSGEDAEELQDSLGN